MRTESGSIGFLNDTRRLNVALTRAKCSLFILGKTSALMRNPVWREMIEDAKSRNCYVPYDFKMWEVYSRMRHVKSLKQQAVIADADKAAILEDVEAKSKPVVIQVNFDYLPPNCLLAQSIAQRRLNEEGRRESSSSTALIPPARKPFDIDSIINRND